MSGASFGSEFARLDAARSPDEMLEFLDRVAAVAAVRDGKRAATEALSLAAGDRVLDLGCGTGVDLLELLAPTQPGGEVVGVDSSERAIAVAAARVSGHDGVRVRTADAYALPFADGSFHAARADRILLHLERADAALAELRRVLAPGGRLAVLEMATWLDGPPELLEHDVHRAADQGTWETGEQRGRVELFLPLLFARASFRVAELDRGEGVARDLDDVDALLRLRQGLGAAVADGRLAADAVPGWIEDLRANLAGGTAAAHVSHTRYLAIAQ